jgi:hypothetical protein
MKAIARRLHRLENQFGSPGETEYNFWSRQRLEAAHRRIAEARKRGELPPAEEERPLTEFEQRRLEDLGGRLACRARLTFEKKSLTEQRIHRATTRDGGPEKAPNGSGRWWETGPALAPVSTRIIT